MLTLQNLQHQWPSADRHYPGLIEGMASAAPTIFPKYGITTDLVIAHAMAQFSVESWEGTSLAENTNYTAQRLLQVFPAHFNATTAAQAAHNPILAAQLAYGGRLGNALYPSLDGYNYRGAGLLQLTGKAVYAELQAFLNKHNAGFSIIDKPGLLASPDHALECGVANFVVRGCIPYAENDDVAGVTKRVNGALGALAQRTQALALWKKELGV